MKNVLFFDLMLTPKIITFVYWLLLVVLVFWGLSSAFAGMGGVTFGGLVKGLLISGAGAVGARIWCELLIVLFKIHENIRHLATERVKA